jgi:hypothetical protein
MTPTVPGRSPLQKFFTRLWVNTYNKIKEAAVMIYTFKRLFLYINLVFNHGISPSTILQRKKTYGDRY